MQSLFQRLFASFRNHDPRWLGIGMVLYQMDPVMKYNEIEEVAVRLRRQWLYLFFSGTVLPLVTIVLLLISDQLTIMTVLVIVSMSWIVSGLFVIATDYTDVIYP
jgi:hypothetical protein